MNPDAGAAGAESPYVYPFGKTGEVVFGISNLAYSCFTLLFWTGAIMLIVILPTDNVRQKVMEMDLQFETELDSIIATYEIAALSARTDAQRAAAIKKLEDDLNVLPLMARLPAYNTFISPGVYWPILLFSIASFIGNLMLLWISIVRIACRPAAIKWLRIAWVAKTAALFAGTAAFLLFARGPLNAMFDAMVGRLSTVYSSLNVPMPEEMVWMVYGFWFGLLMFALLMLIWPFSTFILLLFYKKRNATTAGSDIMAHQKDNSRPDADLHEK
jgi:hypothetical protein